MVHLVDMGETLSAGMQLSTLLNSVSSECDAVVTAMRTLQDDLTWDTCVTRLIDEGDRQNASRHITAHASRGRRDREGTGGSRALKVDQRNETRKCYNCSQRGHLAAHCGDENLRDEAGNKKEKKSKVKVSKRKESYSSRERDDAEEDDAPKVLLACVFPRF